MSTSSDRAVIAVCGLWLAWIVLCVGAAVGVIAVVIHFIHKLW